jgi:hypothetical protein
MNDEDLNDILMQIDMPEPHENLEEFHLENYLLMEIL